jgi:hypothetical protein
LYYVSSTHHELGPKILAYMPPIHIPFVAFRYSSSANLKLKPY